jgi:hypothetical protein
MFQKVSKVSLRYKAMLLTFIVLGVPPAKREFTTLRKFQNKKPNFSTLKLRNWTFFVTLEKRPIAEYGKCEKRF